MPSPELELVSNIVKTGDFGTLRKRGITPEFFQTEEGADVFQWLWDEYHDTEQRGEVPDRARLLRKFPDFDWCPSRNSVPALLSELAELNLSREMEQLTEQLVDEMEEGIEAKLVLQAFLPAFRDLNVKNAQHSGYFIRDSAARLRQRYKTKKEHDGVTGIPFPWAPLNRVTGGMHPEQFILFYGRPKQMKTWLALVCAVEAYMANRRVFIFSKEMSMEDMEDRTAALIARLNYSKYKAAELSEEDEEKFYDKLDNLAAWEDGTAVDGKRRSLYLDSDRGRRKASTVDDLIARAERFEPDLVIVDGLYLMSDGRTGKRTSDWKQISHISQDLKGMAQYLEVPLLGTTQANRANAKNPTDALDDLSFADSLGQDADLAMRVFKGPNEIAKFKYALALTFPGFREGDLSPFLINGAPAEDFSVIQKHVDMKRFLNAHTKMAKEEEESESTSSSGKKKPASKTRKKKGGKGDKFRAIRG